MSLFGNLGSKPATSGSPASSAPAFGSLFTKTTTTSPGTTPSLFGTSTSAAPATSGAAAGGLFGNLGAATSNATASSAPAASTLGGATSQPQSTGLGSLFSKPASQPAPASSLFSMQQTGGLGQSGLFSGASNAATQPQQGPAGALLEPNQANARSAHFDHLLERGRKRNAGENGLGNFDELPALQLGLGDIARKVRNLGTGGPSADLAQDRAAHYLLSASGVKMGSTLRDLNQFSTQAGLNATGAAASILDTDVDSYISNLHSQSTLALIQEGLEQSKRDFDAFLEDNVQIEWDKQRQRIYEHFGLGKQSEDMAASQATFSTSAARGAFGRSTRRNRAMGTKSTNGASFAASAGPPVIGSVTSPYQKRSVNGDSSFDKSILSGHTGPGDRHIRDKQEKFMGTIKKLNKTRLQRIQFPILHEFCSVEKTAYGENSDHFINAYHALASITNEKEGGGIDGPKEREFFRQYLDESPNSVPSVAIRKRILDGSRKYLEKKFLDHVQEVLEKNARDARQGGEPTKINKIKGYVRAKIAQKELGAEIEHLQKMGGEFDEYPWVILFYLLRAGLNQDAAEFVRERKTFFQNNDRNFLPAVTRYAEDPERRLSFELQQKINHVYSQRQRIAPSNDPYRMACYKIIGRCEMSRRNLDSIKENMDDWIWLQFNLAREGNRAEENAGEIFGLEEIRTTVTDIGKRHFMNDDTESAGGYGVYFYLAILAGMFESAVSFLYQHNYVSAVHFAIALDYYGLLRVSDFNVAGTEILTYTTKQQPQFNFAWVVGRYTADFRAARADAAAEYLILICLNADLPNEMGKQQAELCHEALRELVLETREFATLLGDVKSNGRTTPGLIQERIDLIKLLDEDALVNSIISLAAKVADDNGRTNDAVLLNHLAGQYDNVVAILNRALSEALSVELGQEPLRLEPLKPRLSTAAQQPQAQDSSASLSMLGTDNPVVLAERVIALYDQNSLWWRKVVQTTRDTLGALYKLNDAKRLIESRTFTQALDKIQGIDILPLNARGNLSEIRSCANKFSTFAPEIARNIGNVLLWCIGCCSQHRATLLDGAYQDPTRQALAEDLLQKAKDLMVFAGLIRYKLPPRVFETLAREGGSVGAY